MISNLIIFLRFGLEKESVYQMKSSIIMDASRERMA